MSWKYGLILVIVVAIFVPWLFSEIADRFGTRDDDEWDDVAERKRQIAKRARDLSGEHK